MSRSDWTCASSWPRCTGPTWFVALGCAGVLLVLALAVVGAITTVRWLVDLR